MTLQHAQDSMKSISSDEESEEGTTESDEESEEEPSKTPKKNVNLCTLQFVCFYIFVFWWSDIA